MRYWEELLANYPRIAIGITRSLGRHITDVHARIAELATEEVEQRVAHAVLRLARSAGTPVEGGLRIDFPITRQDLAEMTGTTLHSVSRIVSGLGRPRHRRPRPRAPGHPRPPDARAHRPRREGLTPGAYWIWAKAASKRSCAFLGFFTALAASRFDDGSPTTTTATMPIAKCGVHLTP